MLATFLEINRLAANCLLVFLLPIILLLTSGLITAQAAEQSVRLAGMDVTVWSQETDRKIKHPVIIFSHGFHGCATQSRFLMEAFASAGYLIFAPNHRDATCHGGKAKWMDRPEVPFRKARMWNETSFRDRAEDIRRLIEAIRTDDRFRERVDWTRCGLAGHSLGGYTVLGLAGAWPSWKLGGVRAVLALSPYTQPFLLHRTLTALSAPVMYQGGTWDYGVTPSLHKSMGAYDQSPQPKYYVEFDRMGHFAWADVGRKAARRAIIAYSLTFMNYYVKGEPPAPSLTEPLPGVALFKYASELGNSGR
ncbi:MAG: alpha/beta hydrolase family protein [Desulfomonilaceae bacterium]